jgi:methyl-accepting chemotaxis protein
VRDKMKNLGVGAKLALGFSAIVAMAVLVAYMGWSGLRGVASTNAETDLGAGALRGLQHTLVLEREVRLLNNTQSKDVDPLAEQWRAEHKSMRSSLEKLGSSKLDPQNEKLVTDAVTMSERYSADFDAAIKAKKKEDDSYALWRTQGGKLTEEILALKKAADGGAYSAATAPVFENLMLMRVPAVYFIGQKSDDYFQQYTTALKTLQTTVAGLKRAVGGNAQFTASALTIEKDLADYEQYGQAFKSGVDGYKSASVTLQTQATEMDKQVTQVDGSLTKSADAISARSLTVSVAVGILAVVFGVGLAFFITQSISRPLDRVIASLTLGGEQVASASNQIAQASQQMAEGSSEQASSLEETSSSLEEMASMTRQNAENAKQANLMSSEMRVSAEKGMQAMEQMSGAIGKIKDSADATAKIIKTIDEIAFQTNLLALNAAVEAARAGEAGKGFAVVAEEVRNLAQRSAEAAKTTSALIEESQGNAGNGVTVTNDVAELLRDIVEKVQKVSDLVAEVSAASDEQAQGIDQVNLAVSQMDRVTQSNASNAEESASASEELSAQARELNEMVSVLQRVVTGGRAGEVRQMTATSRVLAADSTKTAMDTHEVAQLVHQLLRRDERESLAKAAGGGSGRVRKMRPEEVIPLDDDELRDF